MPKRVGDFKIEDRFEALVVRNVDYAHLRTNTLKVFVPVPDFVVRGAVDFDRPIHLMTLFNKVEMTLGFFASLSSFASAVGFKVSIVVWAHASICGLKFVHTSSGRKQKPGSQL